MGEGGGGGGGEKRRRTEKKERSYSFEKEPIGYVSLTVLG